MSVKILHGDCIEEMRKLPANSVDSVVTDPPYGIGFMGSAWDGKDIVDRLTSRRAAASTDASAGPNGAHKSAAAQAGLYDLSPVAMRAFQAFSADWAREAFRVLKPGGHLISFASTRTYHRMVCGIEEAGFEIRDCIRSLNGDDGRDHYPAWVFGAGFPKSLNLDRERGNAICGCEPEAQHEVRHLRDGHVPPAEHAYQGHSEVLQQGLSEQGLHAAVQRTEPSEGAPWREERSVEGRSDGVQEEGQLQGRSLHACAGVGQADGAGGWLRDGTSAGDGRMVRVPADQDGSGASPGPRPHEERPQQSGALAGQPKPQTGRAWPLCGGCGKPVLPKGIGTALKPAWEPICLARKPLQGTVAANVLEHGTGGLNIDGCRVDGEGNKTFNRVPGDRSREQYRTGSTDGPAVASGLGRWPANVLHDGSPEVVDQFPSSAGAQSPVKGTEPTANGFSGNVFGEPGKASRSLNDRCDGGGSAARFFWCPKTSPADRHAGLKHPGPQFERGSTLRDAENLPKTGNHHPTVKPTELMRYLCRLVTPPGGTVLDPFMGSGSTLKAAELEGFSAIGIELDAAYIAIARRRIAADAPLFAEIE